MTVAAASATATAGGAAVALTATLSGGAAGPISWSLESDLSGDAGSVTSTGTTSASYVPPAAASATFHVTVRATAAAGISGVVVLAVSPEAGPTPSITVAASQATATAGGSGIALTATLGGGATGPLTWSVTSDGAGSAGTVASTGATTATYTPPASVTATIHATVKATGSGGVFGTTTITVSPASALRVTPRAATVYAGSAPVSIDATRTDGGTFADAVWTIESSAADAGAFADAWEDWASYRPPASVTAPIVVTVVVTVGSVTGRADLQVVPVPGGARVVVTPASQAAFAGADPLELTATLLGGAQGPVTWTLASGSPGTLSSSGEEGATYTPPASVDAPVTVSFTATPATGEAATGTILLTPAGDGATVSGRVLSADSRRAPVAGAVVQIADATTTTAADGTFTLSGVAAPYTLAVITGTYSLDALVVEGVTTLSPEVLVDAAWPSYSSVTISGAFVNASESGFFPALAVTGPGVAYSGGSTSAVDYSVDLVVSPPTTATIRALETSYSGEFGRYGARTIDVTSQSPVEGIDLTYGDPVVTGTVAGTFQPPAGTEMSYASFEAQFDAYGMDVLTVGRDLATGGFTTAIPLLPGATSLWLGGQYYTSTRWGSFKRRVASGDTDISLLFPELPFAIAPADTAALSTSGALVWSGSGGSTVEVDCYRPGRASVSFTIRTSATSTRIPALQGMGLASGDECTWTTTLADDGRPVGATVDPSAAGPAFVARGGDGWGARKVVIP